VFIPVSARIGKLDRITPTIYEAALKCVSRAEWVSSGDKTLIPTHPRALLGIGTHKVFERLKGIGSVAGDVSATRSQAVMAFDEIMQELFSTAHPLLRTKFANPTSLPFYNLFRSRIGQIALGMVRRPATQAAASKRAGVGRSAVSLEQLMVSRDKTIAGRPDVVDENASAIIDYKTGAAPQGPQLTDSELRQLRLYIYLAGDNGISITRGIVERIDGTRVEKTISAAEAQEEAQRAIRVLEQHNRYVGMAFADAATPSPDNCRFCPCIPFCEAFWDASRAEWAVSCGTHVQGEITSIEGDALISIELTIDNGSCERGTGVVTRLSREWVSGDNSPPLDRGETLRVTDVYHAVGTKEPAVYRADRISTAPWRFRSKA